MIAQVKIVGQRWTLFLRNFKRPRLRDSPKLAASPQTQPLEPPVPAHDPLEPFNDEPSDIDLPLRLPAALDRRICDLNLVQKLLGDRTAQPLNNRIWSLFIRQISLQRRTIKRIRNELSSQFGELEISFRPIDIKAEESMAADQFRRNSQKRQYSLQNASGQRLNMAFTGEDFEKLLPGNDLNDIIIENYLKLMKLFLLPASTADAVFMFSTYFLQKLLDFVMTTDMSVIPQQEGIEMARKVTAQHYERVQRWTKKVDIFSKQFLVFPINMYKHWFCVLVLDPGAIINSRRREGCQIIFCDSMFEGRNFVVESIRTYLEMELKSKKNIEITVNSLNCPVYQLLLPRQTNLHDCGLYMLTFIEELLLNHHLHLHGLENPANRHKLKILPRLYLQSLRHRTLELFLSLFPNQSPHHTSLIIVKHTNHKEKLKTSLAFQLNDDLLDMSQFEKWMSLEREWGVRQQANEKQQFFSSLVRFYYSMEANYYESDDSPGNDSNPNSFEF